MNKLIPIALLSFAAASGAYAQAAGGVTMSTDPAKAAAVEKHAQELQARQAQTAAPKATAAKHKVKHATKAHAGAKTAKKTAAKKT
jgi:hypothetical protein